MGSAAVGRLGDDALLDPFGNLVPSGVGEVSLDAGRPLLHNRGYQESASPHELPVNVPSGGVRGKLVPQGTRHKCSLGVMLQYFSKDSLL